MYDLSNFVEVFILALAVMAVIIMHTYIFTTKTKNGKELAIKTFCLFFAWVIISLIAKWKLKTWF